MNRSLLFVILIVTASHASAEMVVMGPSQNLLGESRPILYDRLTPVSTPRDPGGDTYDIAILGQSSASVYALSDATPSSHVFDGASEFAGNNLAAAPGGTFQVIEAYLPGAGLNGGDLVIVEVTAFNASGAASPWIEAGVTSPDGDFREWRLDIGSNAAGTDDINWTPATPFSVLDTGVTLFDSFGGSYGTFSIIDSSDADGVSGVALIGLGGANIAGFDMATMQVFWEVAKIPEPSSVVLGGALCLGVLAARRRFR